MKKFNIAIIFLIFVLSKEANANCRILAYYPDWVSSYKYDKIPYTKLTHICHAFMEPDINGNVSGPTVESGLITNAHLNGVKVLVSVGGAAVPSSTFSTLMNNSTARNNLINNIYNFCATYGYDGADIDWEYPQNSTDRTNLNTFITALRNKFNTSPQPAPTWLITMAVPGGAWGCQYIDFSYLNAYVDFYNVMTYDMHGSWSSHSGHNSSIYRDSDPCTSVNCEAYMNYIVNTRSVPASKVNMGMPFYGYNFTTTENLYESCGGNCSATYIAYKDIAPLIGNGWTYYWDSASIVPYLRKDLGAGVISYDNPQSIEQKVYYALITRSAGGVFMWEITQDYIAGNQPLMNAMYNAYINVCGATPTFTMTVTGTPPTNTPTPVPTPIRVNCGGIQYTGGDSKVWLADKAYVAGSWGYIGGQIGTDTTPGEVLNTNDDTLYYTERYNNPTYRFTVQNGVWAVVLYFSEFYYTATGQRVFSVSIEGTPVLTNYDIIADTGGPDRAVAKQFTFTITDGVIDITSSSTVDLAKFSAIEVIPGSAETPTPTNTFTYTRTNTATNTRTYTSTITASFTVTNTQTYINTSTFTFTASFTRTPTETVTGSQPPTWTNTDTPTETPIYTITFTPTHTFTFTGTPTQDLNIANIVAYPNPYIEGNDLKIKITLNKNANLFTFKLYTFGYRLVKEIGQKVDMLPGENKIILNAKYLRNLANGIYYYIVIVNDKFENEVKSEIKILIKQ